MTAPDRPLRTTDDVAIVLDPVADRLQDEWSARRISEDESRENLGAGLRNGFWIAAGMWLGVFAVLLVVLS